MCDLKFDHCSLCGDEAEATEFNDGYSSCCNEPIRGAGDCDETHER